MSPVSERLAAALSTHYRIEHELGAGGMATVYLAHDIKHDRKVAVKVLRPELAAVIGAERFLAEIKTTAHLQHPHILPLFDSGEEDSFLFYVMPYVEGVSLRDRLRREKQLPIQEALRIASEVAEGLDYAHRHGVVHRDIKPENIMLHDGSAFVADFGIALAASKAGTRMTETGVSLGTPQYMSPEQAMGERDLDARSDVYALGCVTYEMLTGEPPFAGPTAQAIIAKVMTVEPTDALSLRRTIPLHVADAVRVALQKLPADRFATAALFAAALSSGGMLDAATRRALAAIGGARRRTTLRWAGGILAVGMLAAWGLRSIWSGQQNSTPVRFAIEADSGYVIDGAPVVSPDGKTLVYAMRATTGITTLFSHDLDDIAAHPIAGTAGASEPFFSPTGTSIGFVLNGRLQVMRLDGNTPKVVAMLSARIVGATWGTDDRIVYAISGTHLYNRVAVAGGTPEALRVGDSTMLLFSPQLLPGNTIVLSTVAAAGYDEYQLATVNLATGQVRYLGPGRSARFVAPDRIVFIGDGGKVFSQSFSLARLDTVGTAVQIADHVADIRADYGALDASPTGTIAYQLGDPDRRDLTLIGRNGSRQTLLSERGVWVPRFAPDGSNRIAFGAFASDRDKADIWIYDLLTRSSPRRLTTAGRDSNDPTWSPDGRRIAFNTTMDSSFEDIYIQDADGRGSAQLLTRRPGAQWTSDWSHDGRMIVYTNVFKDQNVWIKSATSADLPQPLLASPSNTVTAARLSPDDRWIAYTSGETGRFEVYVQAFPGLGNKILVSDSGGNAPAWGANGKELYYWRGNRLIAVQFTSTPVAMVRGRTELFTADYVSGPNANYDVSKDGQQFVVVTKFPQKSQLLVGLNIVRPKPRP